MRKNLKEARQRAGMTERVICSLLGCPSCQEDSPQSSQDSRRYGQSLGLEYHSLD